MENPQYLKWVQWGAAILFGLVITWWFMRGVKKAKVGLRQALEESRARQAAHESQKIAKPGDGTNEDPSKDIAAVIDSNPEAVGRLLRNWMYEAVK